MASVKASLNVWALSISEAREIISTFVGKLTDVSLGKVVFNNSVEPLLKDPLAKRHCIKYFSTVDSI